MKDLIGAMNEEQKYITDKMNGIDTSLPTRLASYGYSELREYFIDKREYLLVKWTPDVIDIDVKTLTTDLENAIKNKEYGIYFSTTDGLYAFHGSEAIDYELCERLNICVAELYYKGGTIIGGSDDMGIEIVAPADLGLDSEYIIQKMLSILSKYIENPVIVGNDILIDGKKVMGSMCRYVSGVFVWAAQFSFADHTDIISQICSKKSVKEPGYIDSALLTKEILRDEVVTWLQRV